MELIEILSLLMLLAAALHWGNTQSRRQRTALLAEHLQPFQIEKRMQQLTEAYMRALGETDLQRQAQIWQIQEPAEQQLSEEFRALAQSFAQVPAPQARFFPSPNGNLGKPNICSALSTLPLSSTVGLKSIEFSL